MNDLTTKQKIVLATFTFISLSTIFVIGLILDALIYCVAIFIVFAIINTILDIKEKKNHAPSIRIGDLTIETVYMCYLVSNLMFFMVMVACKYSERSMGNIQAGILGIILITFASVILSGIFYFKPRGQSNYQILIDYIKHYGLTDEFLNAEALLKQRVTPTEYLIFKRILIDGHDWESIQAELEVHPTKIKESLDKTYHYVIGRLGL